MNSFLRTPAPLSTSVCPLTVVESLTFTRATVTAAALRPIKQSVTETMIRVDIVRIVGLYRQFGVRCLGTAFPGAACRGRRQQAVGAKAAASRRTPYRRGGRSPIPKQ